MGLQDGLASLNVKYTGSVTAGNIDDSDTGKVISASIGSPGAFGALIQAGSVGTAAGSGGFIALRQPYTSANYAVLLTPFNAGSIAGFISGVLNATSGVNMVGGPSNSYFWAAIGI